MSRSQLEGQILRKFERGLEQAIERHEDYNMEDVDSIARQKLLLHAIRHFGLEDLVTIQWFKDGDVLTELDNHDTKTTITNAGVDNGSIPNKEEIVEYFIDGGGPMTLDPVLDIDDRKEWLNHYYESHDEIPFEQIYSEGMTIHLHIREIAKCCSRDGNTSDLPDDLVSVIDTATSRLKEELNKFPLFRNIPPYVTEFNRIATTILGEFEVRISEQNVSLSEFAGIFYQLNEFYYETVWDTISNRIGFYTAEGPNEDTVRQYRKGSLNVSKDTFRVELDKLRNVCNTQDIHLEPRIERLPDLQDEYWDLEDILDWNISTDSNHTTVSG